MYVLLIIDFLIDEKNINELFFYVYSKELRYQQIIENKQFYYEGNENME